VQAAALAALRRGRGGTHLLFGVTGSGKTEVYFRLIEDALAAGRGALLLVPEIALTAQLVDLVQARFGPRAAVLHSAVGEAARRSAMRRLHEGLADVVVGPRSAVFAPVDPGVVIVDEQHEASYQQEDAPRYHAQEIAMLRAARRGATLVLGSATPDLGTFQAASEGRIGLVELPERIAGRPLPEVRLVDLRRTPGRIFTPELMRAVRDGLRQGQQAILLLNRRGLHPSMVCTACGHVPTCPECSVALAFHEGGEAVCHLCGWRAAAPPRCPACHGPLRLLGTGTQRVAQAAMETWPGARVLRLDRDAVQRVGGADKVYAQFRRGGADILVGTQMVAKGFDFPLVTTVGVVVADIGLGQPDYRAAERTFQLLMQVTGRAGRAEHPGRAIIQAFDPEHPAFRFAARHDYRGFAAQELRERRRGGYPPFGELLLIGYSGIEESAVAELAMRRSAEIRRLAGPDVRVLGPAPAPISRAKGRYRFQTLLIAPRREQLRQAAATLPPLPDTDGLREALFFDPRQFR
jgi:primosomal protein N' (replication factor Y)